MADEGEEDVLTHGFLVDHPWLTQPKISLGSTKGSLNSQSPGVEIPVFFLTEFFRQEELHWVTQEISLRRSDDAHGIAISDQLPILTG